MDPASQLFRPRKRKSKPDKFSGVAEWGDSHSWAALISMALFLVLVFIAPLLTYRATPGDDGDSSIRQIGYAAALLCAGYGMYGTVRKPLDYLVPIPILITLGWCWLSVLWAVDSDTSLRRVILTTLVVFTTFWSTRALGYDKVLAVVRAALTLLLIANYIAVYANPELGTHLENPLRTFWGPWWRGIMAHKNFAGAASALTILFFLFDAKKVPATYKYPVIFFSGIFLYASQSKTSAGMVGIAILSGVVFKWFSGRLRNILIFLIVMFTGIFYVVEQIFADVIRDEYLGPTAFTGRGQIWSTMLRYSADHPLLGAGFESFWNIGPASPVYHYGTGFTTVVTVGHNGYLDLLVTIGYPGLILAVYSLMIWPMMRLLVVPELLVERAGLICALLIFCIGHNFTESSLYERDAFVGVTLLFVTAVIKFFPANAKKKSRTSEDSRDVMRTMRRRRRRSEQQR